jgi:hypothetical protein
MEWSEAAIAQLYTIVVRTESSAAKLSTAHMLHAVAVFRAAQHLMLVTPNPETVKTSTAHILKLLFV